jgi:replicative DNA helicase
MAAPTVSDVLPHSEEAERSVLGAILVDNQQFERAREIVGADSFYSPRNQQIFDVLQKLVDSGSALDVVTV